MSQISSMKPKLMGQMNQMNPSTVKKDKKEANNEFAYDSSYS